MHAFRSYIFAARIACDSGPTCTVLILADEFIEKSLCLGSVVSVKSQRLSHEETTDDDTAEYKCADCGKSYRSGSALKLHSRNHSADRAFACSVCNKRFTRLAHLERHSVIHTGVKPHKCFVCAKAFGRAEHLRIHVKSHSGERPFKCHVCKKRFTTSSSLTTHRRSHTGEKPYKCQVTSFSTVINLLSLPQRRH